MNKIAVLWESYRRDVVPQDAPRIQVVESRRAFYAGASALLAAISSALSPGEDATTADVMMMENIAAELENFRRAVVRGEA